MTDSTPKKALDKLSAFTKDGAGSLLDKAAAIGKKKQKKPTRTDKKKAEKRQIEFMRAAREAGMSYGKYRASGGVKPLEQEIFKGTIKTTDAWMGPAQCIYVGPDPRIKPKARIKRKAI